MVSGLLTKVRPSVMSTGRDAWKAQYGASY